MQKTPDRPWSLTKSPSNQHLCCCCQQKCLALSHCRTGRQDALSTAILHQLEMSSFCQITNSTKPEEMFINITGFCLKLGFLYVCRTNYLCFWIRGPMDLPSKFSEQLSHLQLCRTSICWQEHSILHLFLYLQKELPFFFLITASHLIVQHMSFCHTAHFILTANESQPLPDSKKKKRKK